MRGNSGYTPSLFQFLEWRLPAASSSGSILLPVSSIKSPNIQHSTIVTDLKELAWSVPRRAVSLVEAWYSPELCVLRKRLCQAPTLPPAGLIFTKAFSVCIRIHSSTHRLIQTLLTFHFLTGPKASIFGITLNLQSVLTMVQHFPYRQNEVKISQPNSEN